MQCLWINPDAPATLTRRLPPAWPADQVDLTFTDVQQALQVLSEAPIDLIVAPWQALGADPAGACARLHHQTQLPLLVITRAQDPVAAIVALESGACDVVNEQVGAAELLARMRAAVRRARRAF
ncbi:MAG: hypothetical protein RLZZ182_2402 [Pseudomonadota bacterium]|jgi:two-component system KDP operon response regulator KdpE